MPKGLIPLMLSPKLTESFGPGPSRASLVQPAGQYTIPCAAISPTSPAHKRNASDVTPMIKLSRPPVRTPKRLSQQVPASLPVLPFTSAEWKRAIAEIKKCYVTRRYRACSARCNEILTNTKDLSMVQPAYLIYLNFYAAASLEMCARPLQPGSSYRATLLQQARGHYSAAQSLIKQAEEVAVAQSRSTSAASSLPSLHSPSGSVSSRAWTPESCLMAPTWTHSRKSSLQQEPRSGGRERPKKKVSFELPKDKDRWSFRLPEPIVRPDSPTLGFDDEYFASGASRQDLPELPLAAGKRWSEQDIEFEPLEVSPASSPPPMPSISEDEEPSPSSSPSSEGFGPDACPFGQFGAVDTESARSVSRYCETLSSLKTQVDSHMASLNQLLQSDEQLLQHNQLLQSPLLYDATAVDDDEEARSLDRMARIDKLRMNGWKRKRFDASRYELLCETAMAELNAN
ncbi:hypothetical protein KVR01_005129 [Diaporthe batatas]|uniref:uncharacterized protein n=1 Tax=Diaporthe batatas TaxID=748121 RepID=UPI001D05A556|nr:uncharacterized protein KVR01_005129 [Diaporthe batatas]KAG8164854.1 hypothetical protein KVR01_005129 [Diaporthe batatas]